MTADALQLLPPRGLDQSILVGILVGLIVLLILCEWFGWVFVGLVVPGYLASVFVIQPAAGATVVMESMITFVIVRALSDGIARTDAWSPFFGRDRFFLIVLVSVIVRQASQLWLLEATLGQLDSSLGMDLYAEQDFFSIGLVLVPLTANMFWKLTLRRGVIQIGVPVLITYAVLRFLLLPATNLSFSLLELTYEDVALDFLGSAKAYVILLCGAFMAARLNLAYGWDFNGILVPSLMALTWFAPMTAIVTMVEAVVLLGLTRVVLLLPGFKTANLEGPRKVTLVFVLGFFLKYAVAWYTTAFHPSYDVTGLFGFGYVLTSLLAVKMLSLRTVGRVVLPTTLVSLAAFVVGSAVGFGLEMVAPGDTAPRAPAGDAVATTRLADEPVGLAVLARARARPALPPGTRSRLSGTVLSSYARAWRDIDRWLERGGEPPNAVRDRLDRLGLDLIRLPGPALRFAVLEREERLRYQRGLGTAMLAPGRPGPVLEVPRPRTEAPSAEAAAVLCERLRCRAILWSGADSADAGTTDGDALSHPRAPMHVAHLRLRAAPVLAIRADASLPRERVVLHLRHTLAREIDLRALWPEPLEIAWSAPPGGTLQWDAGDRFAVLRAHPDALIGAMSIDSPPLLPVAGRAVGDDAMADIEASSASETELRGWEQLIDDLAGAAAGDQHLVRWLARAAASFDYRLVALADCAGPAAPCWLLEPDTDGPQWGVVAVRADGRDVALEVPRPRAEPGTLALGVNLWRALDGRLLYLGPPAPHTPNAVDPTAIGAVATPLQAFHRSAHRALAPAAGVILQIRGYASWRPITDDLVVGLGAPTLQPRQIPPALAALFEPDGALARIAGPARIADGGPTLYPLVAQGNPQLAHSATLGRATTALLWFSSRLRDEVRARDATAAMRQLERLAIPTHRGDPVAALTTPPVAEDGGGDERFDRALALALDYADTGDVHALAALRDRARADGVDLAGGDAAAAGGAYLLLRREHARAVVPLAGRTTCPPRSPTSDALARALTLDLLAGCRAVVVQGRTVAP